ncbi:condensation domain-containing protein [Streptomyces sp. NPDC048257]|uniref:condensation domain-containing protein n=1 Tax=Streptomyces sp. NPDC048257 TaxID=3365526 RepID=UPI0037141770
MAATVAMTVVLTPGPPTSLDLHGRLTPAALTAALASLPPCTPTLHRHTAHHHTLTLPPPPFPAGRLSDLLTGAATAGEEPHTPRTPHGTPPPAPTRPPGCAARQPHTPPPTTPLQRDVLLDAMTHPGAALHVEQLHWRWYGPLDPRRFAAAWQTLYDSEAVLRTALARPATPGAGPLLAVHPHAAPQLERHTPDSTDWHTLLLNERTRDFDLYRPGTALRIALLHEPGRVSRVLLTYHQALLDGWSARLLQRTLHRTYLADGRPLGSGRRPDIRDHLHWLARQDPAPARAFWARGGPPAGAAGLPGRTSHRPQNSSPHRRGHGRTHQHLTPHQALRLRNWAAERGATESTALHTAWALQLHRATPAAPAVTFAAAVSGRGIPLPGAERLPGPLRSALPLHVRIDPAAPLTHLLTTLAGQALEAASYEWVAPGQAAQWSPSATTDPGRDPGAPAVPDSLIAFEANTPTGPAGDPLPTELAAEGVRAGAAETIAAHTALPFAVTAHHDTAGGLVLTCVYDRARVADTDAAETLAQTALLLRELPAATGETSTVADALALLDAGPVPRIARPASTARTLRILRAAARTGAGTICLVPPPDAPPGCYDALAAAYLGPQALATVPPPADARTVLAALRPALARGEPLLLGGFSGAGSLACAVAERIASHGWHPPRVAIGGTLTTEGDPGPVRALAQALQTASAATTTARP